MKTSLYQGPVCHFQRTGEKVWFETLRSSDLKFLSIAGVSQNKIISIVIQTNGNFLILCSLVVSTIQVLSGSGVCEWVIINRVY